MPSETRVASKAKAIVVFPAPDSPVSHSVAPRCPAAPLSLLTRRPTRRVEREGRRHPCRPRGCHRAAPGSRGCPGTSHSSHAGPGTDAHFFSLSQPQREGWEGRKWNTAPSPGQLGGEEDERRAGLILPRLTLIDEDFEWMRIGHRTSYRAPTVALSSSPQEWGLRASSRA